MKYKTSLFITSALFIMNILILNPHVFAGSGEEKALDGLAEKMLTMQDKLKGKRICMFKFTSIEGNETPEGAKISQHLLERLMNKSSLRFVDRSELAKIVGEQELEQAGLVDRELTNEESKILPIDLMITGTIAKIDNRGYIYAKVLDARTSEVYIAKSAEYDDIGTVTSGETSLKKDKEIPAGNINAGESTEAAEIFRRSPEQLDRLNRAFYNLQQMSERRPVVFLMAVLDRSEMQTLERTRPRLAAAIRDRREKLQRNEPLIFEKIANLRKGLAVMKDSFPSRYELIMKKKTEVIDGLRRRAGR